MSLVGIIVLAATMLPESNPPARPAPQPNCRPPRLTRNAVLFESVQFVRPIAVSPARLRKEVRSVTGRWRWTSPCRKQLEVSLRRRVKQALENRGYLKAQIKIELARAGASASARVSVRTGPRSRVGALDVTSVSIQVRLKLLRRVRSRSGAAFSPATVERDRRAISLYFKDRGHPFARTVVYRKLHSNGRLLDLLFKPVPGPWARVRSIEVRGASATGVSLVTRALANINKKPYNQTRIDRALARLRKTGAFNKATARCRKAGKARVVVVVQVSEKPLP